jgi:hypothetical protein
MKGHPMRKAEHITMMIAWSQLLHSERKDFHAAFDRYITTMTVAAARKGPSDG